jgi:hypothetical protein
MLGRNKGSTTGRLKSNISEMASARRTGYCSPHEPRRAQPRPPLYRALVAGVVAFARLYN